mgnify:CR=1 FL=1
MSEICIIVTIVVYLAAMLLVGFAYSKTNNDSADFYLGGRKMGPLVTAMSAEASDMSSWLLMGMPGLAYLTGIASPGWTAIGLALGTWLNWLIVARRLRRYSANLDAITVPQFLSLRFHDQRNLLNALGAVIIIVFFVPYTASGFAAFCKLLEKPYLRRMTARKGTARTAYHARKTRPVSLRRALLRRELLHLGSSSAYMLNSAMGTLGLLVLGGVSLWKADLFARFAQAVPEGVPVLVCCAVCAVSAANFLTTPSVSLEGRTVWLLQSLPIPSWQALCAKLELHLLLTGVPAALCLVCMQAAVQMPTVYFCLTLLEAELFVLLSAEMGLALGLVLPNLHWTSEAAVIKMSGCTLLSMAANLVAVLVLTLAQTNLLKILPLPAVMAAALVLLAGADGLLGHWLKTRGARRLAELS